MPFGSTFQRFIDQVCRDFSNDIVVFSNSEKEHKLRVLELFERIDTFGVGVNVLKSEFGKDSILFLDHLVLSENIKPLPDILNQFKIILYPLQWISYIHGWTWFSIIESRGNLFSCTIEWYVAGNIKTGYKLNWSTKSDAALLANSSLLIYLDSFSLFLLMQVV